MKTSNITTSSNKKLQIIVPFDVKKFMTLGFVYIIIFIYYLVNIEFKQYFIVYKFYIFFITFSVSFALDILFNSDNDCILDYFSIAVVNSMIAIIMYSIFTDLSINGMFDNYSNEKKIGYLIILILFVLSSINLINSLIS
jgi:hypothetical protein